MAVPASGTLSMQDIAQERLNSTYGSGNVSGPISMYNLINGGNTGGAVTSGNTYPAVNTGCLPNPASRNAYVAFLQVGKYNSSNTLLSTHTFYLNPSQAATIQAVDDGDTLYTDPALTTHVGTLNSGEYYSQILSGLHNDDKACGSDEFSFTFDMDANGVMDIDCPCGGC